LTAYDAASLELALRKGLAIATFDQRLTQAAQKAGLGTIPN
jgi:predicted nucleic acid-binding protein